MKAHSVKEFRVVMPMAVAEYNIGQLWSVMELSKVQTGGGEGVQILTNEAFSTAVHRPTTPLICDGRLFTHGQFTHKVYHMAQDLPAFIRVFAPKGLLRFHEKAWNAFPYARTIITNPEYMKDDFYISIESYHVDDNGGRPNVHGLVGSDLERRQVVKIDIANDKISPKDYRPEWNPCLVGSQRAGRPPIPADGTGQWMNEVKPVMCCYKLVKVWFKWWGLQNRVESYLLSQEYRLFLIFHRQVYCWLDRYYGLNIEDIRLLEEQTKADLELRRSQNTANGLLLNVN